MKIKSPIFDVDCSVFITYNEQGNQDGKSLLKVLSF